MRRGRFFANFKSLLLTTALFAASSFGLQSIALPVHASVHAVQRAAAPSTSVLKIVESDCDLCALATHQAVQAAPIDVFESIESIMPCPEAPRAETLAYRTALLPPARGPPARA